MSSKWELRSKREAQPGIEKLRDFQEGAERQEGQGHRGPEGLSSLTRSFGEARKVATQRPRRALGETGSSEGKGARKDRRTWSL